MHAEQVPRGCWHPGIGVEKLTQRRKHFGKRSDAQSFQQGVESHCKRAPGKVRRGRGCAIKLSG